MPSTIDTEGPQQAREVQSWVPSQATKEAQGAKPKDQPCLPILLKLPHMHPLTPTLT